VRLRDRVALTATFLALTCALPSHALGRRGPRRDRPFESPGGSIPSKVPADPCAPASPDQASESVPDAPHLPAGRVHEIRDLLDRIRYREAEAAARALHAEIAARSGNDSLETAEAIDLLSESSWRIGRADDPRALALAEHAIQVKERLCGKESLEVARSLVILGRLRDQMEEFDVSGELYSRALEIREKRLGPDDLDVAEALYERASSLFDIAKRSEVTAWLERSLEIRERRLGPESPLVAQSLRVLAITHRDTEPAKASGMFQRALAIFRKSRGPDDPAVAEVLYSYGVMLYRQGEYAASKSSLDQALAIRQKALGPDHPSTLDTLDELGVVLWHQGDIAAARPYFEKALSLAELHYGRDNPRANQYANDLGLFHYYLGDYQAARSLLERALAVRERTLKPGDLDLAYSLNNLALVYADDGEIPRARQLAERATASCEGSDQSSDSSCITMFNTLADILRRAGDLEKARSTYEKTVSLWEKLPEPSAFDMSLDLEGLAEVLAERGEVDAAGPLFERALAVLEKALGPDHPLVAEALDGIARLDLLRGKRGEALENALRAEAIARRSFRATARSLAEREALRYETIRSSGLDVALSVLAVLRAEDRSRDSVRRVWDEVMLSRGLVLDEMVSRRRAAADGDGAAKAPLAKDLEMARNRLARLVVEGPDGAGPEQYQARLAAARNEKETAERVLAESSTAVRRELLENRVGLSEAEKALPEGSALVAFVSYRRQAAAGPGAAAAGRFLRAIPSYLAFVLVKGKGGPAVVPLGQARQIDLLIRGWREQVGRIPTGLALAGGEDEERYRRAGDALRRAVWDPIARLTSGARAVYVVPDGSLNLVSLATLPAADDRYLVETGPLLHYLSSEREIVRSAALPAAGGGLLLLGGIDFDARPHVALGPRPPAGQVATALSPATTLQEAGSEQGPEVATVRSGARARLADCSSFESLTFRPLPSSREEVDQIEALWTGRSGSGGKRLGSVLKLTGSSADKETFKKSVAGRRIVHLATHGFFAEGLCPSSFAAARPGESERDAAARQLSAGDDSLLLTGLALAGANRRGRAGKADEGLLTAEEIASLDLSSAEWAVLSACETGTGQVRSGEGVLGLRRAFEVAGARTLILSLWSVEDAAAREWMKELYSGRLEGLSTAEAVRRASRRVIERERHAGRSTHPATWGAFVAAGDWR
jgi:CHAT domain-containing protein/Tfp pilus assembly protein PilF